jgi:signal transduction histidine kinase
VSSVAPSQSWDRVKIRWQHALFVVTLALPAVSALTRTGHGAAGFAIRLGLVAALAAWYGYWFLWRRDTSQVHLPYLIGGSALWAIMAAVDPALLGIGVAVLIPYCLHRPRWAAVAFVVLAVVWLGQRLIMGATLGVSTVLACVLGVVTAVSAVGYIATLDRESRRRQHLLDQLAAAQAELAAAERWAGILTERQRLARDIHDTLTQGFASIALLLDAAQDDLPPQGPATRRVEQALRTARENLAESRRVITALRPSQLDGTRLPHAIRQLTDRIAEETAIAAHTVVTGDPVLLDPATETQLLRAVQEALTNVRRHAAATEVTVTLSYVDELVVVDVADDGVGLPSDQPLTGVGLAGMRERMDSLGGSLSVESAPGEGTTVALSVPVAAR